MNERWRQVRYTAKLAIRTGKYVFVVRHALPAYLRWLAILTIAVKVVTAPLPIDGGVDELLMLVTGALLYWRHRKLLRVCIAAARFDLA